MSVDREAIWLALQSHLQAVLGAQVVTLGRRHVMPPDLLQSQQPALFVCQVRESKDPKLRGTPGKLMLEGFLFLYVYGSAANEAPGQETDLAATQLNALLKAIDDAFAPDTTDGVLTLGGKVSHCWIEGHTDMDPGIFGQQGFAAIPVYMLVP